MRKLKFDRGNVVREIARERVGTVPAKKVEVSERDKLLFRRQPKHRRRISEQDSD